MAKSLQRRLRIFLSARRLTSLQHERCPHFLLPFLTFLFGFFLHSRLYTGTNTAHKFARFHIPPNDHYETARPSFAFIVSTGRTGTQHLSLLLTPKSNTYITHEEEHLTSRTRFVVSEEYRPLAETTPDKFNTSAETYVRKVKIPFYKALLNEHGADTLIYTGHLPFVFGLGPSLLKALDGRVRLLRIRRDRVTTALSLMALGIEEEDPWGTAKHRRWFPSPKDGMVRLRVSDMVWAKLNRFQRYLWYVDDLECRWQGILAEFGSIVAWMEESLEALESFDGGRGWNNVAEFLGVDIDHSKMGVMDNTIQKKGRRKSDTDEALLRDWDRRYRMLVGRCDIGSAYGWDGSED